MEELKEIMIAIYQMVQQYMEIEIFIADDVCFTFMQLFWIIVLSTLLSYVIYAMLGSRYVAYRDEFKNEVWFRRKKEVRNSEIYKKHSLRVKKKP